jgi:hypothetical protein
MREAAFFLNEEVNAASDIASALRKESDRLLGFQLDCGIFGSLPVDEASLGSSFKHVRNLGYLGA